MTMLFSITSISLLALVACCAAVLQDGGDSATGLSTPKIDMHTHIFPDWYKDEIIEAGWVPGPAGGNPPKWNVSMHLQFMDQNNVEKSYVSASSPGTVLYFNDTASAVSLTRRWNDYCANLSRTYPSRFGFFASLPLPYINESLAEIDRALDVLHADAFLILSNGNGQYPGDPSLKPVLDKLNARKAVVLLHPNTPCPSKAPMIIGAARLDYVAPLMDAYYAPTIEFFFDTTRAVMDLLLSGTAAAYKDIKWIIPHAGACLPAVLDRITRLQSVLGPKPNSDRQLVPYSTQNATELMSKRFWFDLAGFSAAQQVWDIGRMFGPDKFLFGSEVPFTPVVFAAQQIRDLNNTLPQLYNDDDIANIFRNNALSLLGHNTSG